MPPNEAAPPPNQIAFDFMSESIVATNRPAGTLSRARSSADLNAGFWFVLGAILVLGVLLVAVTSSGGGIPLMLTVLSTLAILGLFFVFGILAGHIRIGERLSADDLAVGITESIDRGVLVASADGRILFTNRQLEEMTGPLPARDIVGLDMALGSQLACREAFFRLGRAAERGDRHREELRITSASGPARILEIDVAPFDCQRIRKAQPLTLWTISDVTSERSREMTARKELTELLAYYDSAPVGLVALDRAGSVQHVNATLARWLGFGPGVLKERILRLPDILAGDAAELLENVWQKSGHEPCVLDVDATKEDGRLLAVRVIARTAREGARVIAVTRREPEAMQAAGNGLGLSGGAADLRFARFFQSAPFGIASVSADGRISSFNGAFARLVLDAAGGLGKRAVDVLSHADDNLARDSLSDSLKRVLAGKASVQPVETALAPEHVRRVYMSPLVEQANEREAAMLYVIDATEQKALEAQFAQSSKMEAVGKLAGGVAHDFNNVLTAIIGFSDLLLQTHRTSDPSYKDIKNIQQSAYRAAGMVRQLLSFSRRQTLQAEPLLLDDVLHENASMLRTSLGEKISLKIQPSRDLWYVNVDRNEIARVVVNLSVNARDAMPDGGILTLKTRNITERESQRLAHDGMPVGEYVALEVADTGTGMPAEVLEKIFEPFFTTKGIGKGTGLGLSTVYGIVKQSGGFIYADSAPGKGTNFQVFLPRYIVEAEDDLAPVQIAAPREREKPVQASDLTGTGRVLLVEDEDVVRSFAVRALTRQGYEVLEASDGVEALEIVAQNEGRIDIVVTDVVMPEMDGPTMFKALRKTNPSIKVIFVSGYPNEAFRETLGTADVAFLPKPFSLPDLAAKVKEELNRKDR